MPCRQNTDDIDVTPEDRGRAPVSAVTSPTCSLWSEASDRSQSSQIKAADGFIGSVSMSAEEWEEECCCFRRRSTCLLTANRSVRLISH